MDQKAHGRHNILGGKEKTNSPSSNSQRWGSMSASYSCLDSVWLELAQVLCAVTWVCHWEFIGATAPLHPDVILNHHPALSIFPPLLLQWTPSSKRRECGINVPFRTEHPSVCHSSCRPCEGFCVNHHLVQNREAFLMSLIDILVDI